MNCKFKINRILFILYLFGTLNLSAQDPNRFKEEVDQLFNKEYNFSPDKKLVVFTGSSSVRMWKDVPSYFPEYKVINNGFGGSLFSDLIYFYDKIIKPQTSDILFIYEGDNDIASNKKPRQILKEAKILTSRIQKDMPQTRIVYISPKPSLARVQLKKEYVKLNKKLNRFCKKTDNVEFADVWYPMLDTDGNVLKIFSLTMDYT